jgi:hypothetical protein
VCLKIQQHFLAIYDDDDDDDDEVTKIPLACQSSYTCSKQSASYMTPAKSQSTHLNFLP